MVEPCHKLAAATHAVLGSELFAARVAVRRGQQKRRSLPQVLEAARLLQLVVDVGMAQRVLAALDDVPERTSKEGAGER